MKKLVCFDHPPEEGYELQSYGLVDVPVVNWYHAHLIGQRVNLSVVSDRISNSFCFELMSLLGLILNLVFTAYRSYLNLDFALQN